MVFPLGTAMVREVANTARSRCLSRVCVQRWTPSEGLSLPTEFLLGTASCSAPPPPSHSQGAATRALKVQSNARAHATSYSEQNRDEDGHIGEKRVDGRAKHQRGQQVRD